eukprot:Colp12_sorted_trinity150504_noHs@23697
MGCGSSTAAVKDEAAAAESRKPIKAPEIKAVPETKSSGSSAKPVEKPVQKERNVSTATSVDYKSISSTSAVDRQASKNTLPHNNGLVSASLDALKRFASVVDVLGKALPLNEGFEEIRAEWSSGLHECETLEEIGECLEALVDHLSEKILQTEFHALCDSREGNMDKLIEGVEKMVESMPADHPEKKKCMEHITVIKAQLAAEAKEEKRILELEAARHMLVSLERNIQWSNFLPQEKEGEKDTLRESISRADTIKELAKGLQNLVNLLGHAPCQAKIKTLTKPTLTLRDYTTLVLGLLDTLPANVLGSGWEAARETLISEISEVLEGLATA